MLNDNDHLSDLYERHESIADNTADDLVDEARMKQYEHLADLCAVYCHEFKSADTVRREEIINHLQFFAKKFHSEQIRRSINILTNEL